MQTFETYTKNDFIQAFNNSTWCNWLGRYEFPNEFRRIGQETYVDVGMLAVFAINTMGLNLIKGNNTIDAGYQRAFYELIDVPNFETNAAKLNSHQVLKINKDDVYILKDNLNLFRSEIGLNPLTLHFFKKLSSKTYFKLVKNQKMFERIK